MKSCKNKKYHHIQHLVSMLCLIVGFTFTFSTTNSPAPTLNPQPSTFHPSRQYENNVCLLSRTVQKNLQHESFSVVVVSLEQKLFTMNNMYD